MRTSVKDSLKNLMAAVCHASVLAAIVVALLVSSVRASPAQIKTEADIRCLIVGARLSESSDPGMKLTGGMLMTYFLGRLDGRTPGANIERLIVQELAMLTSSDFAEASRRCRMEFSNRGVEFTKIGKALSRQLR